MSRRKPNKSASIYGRLRRGARGEFAAVNWQPLAALDVTCPAEDHGCGQRLVRFQIDSVDAPQVVLRRDTISKAASHVPDADWSDHTIVCGCGRPSTMRRAVVEPLLVGMLDTGRRTARVSSARLAVIRPETL